MHVIGFLCLLSLASIASAQFSPTATLTCEPDAYTVELGGTVSTGRVYIPNSCSKQPTLDGTTTITFNSGNCPGGLPALNTDFTIVVLEDDIVIDSSAVEFPAICNVDIADQTLTSTEYSVGGAISAGETATGSFTPAMTLAIKDNNGAAVTTATIGDTLSLEVSGPTSVSFQIKSISAPNLPIVVDGCSTKGMFNNAVGSSENGVLSYPFNAFLLVPSFDDPINAITFTVVVSFCEGTCAAVSCSARRRRDVIDDANNTTSLTTTINVYTNGENRERNTQDSQMSDKNECVPRNTMTAALAALGVGMILCLALTVILFVRMRNNRKGSRSDEMFANHNAGYKQ